jgi:membrane-bound inhibitor of C-type lysozyme
MRTALVVLALLAATQASAAPVPPVSYRCDDGTSLVARFRNRAGAPGAVDLSFGPGTAPVHLPQVLAADGGRYSGRGVEFRIKGRDATLTRGAASTPCQAAP